MALYRINNNKLTPVKGMSFASYFAKEKKLQNFTEENLSQLFGLEFVATEFNLETFWLDSLAYDPVAKAFVIIEYKKIENFSLMDQGQTYLNLALDHKADLLLKYINKNGKTMDLKDIDWSQTRVMFIGPKFSTYQKRALSNRLPFELWEVNIYEGGLIEYDQIIPTGGDKKSEKKDNGSSLLGAAAKEIEVYTEEDLTVKSEKSKELYMDLKEKLLTFDPSLIFHPTKTYIGVQVPGNWRVLLFINFQTNKLWLDFSRSEPKDYKDPENKLIYKPNSFKNFNQHISYILVNDLDDVDYAVFLFRQTFYRFKKEFNND